MNTKAALISAGIVLTLGFVMLIPQFAMGTSKRGRGLEGRAPEFAPPLRLPPPSPVPAPGHRGFVLTVDLDHPQAATLEKIAEQLKVANPIPAVRLERFRWLDNPNMRVDGWHGKVEEVTMTPRGWVATVRVTPLVTSTFGAITIIADQIFEQYAFVDGQLHFLGMGELPGPSLYGAFTTG